MTVASDARDTLGRVSRHVWGDRVCLEGRYYGVGRCGGRCHCGCLYGGALRVAFPEGQAGGAAGESGEVEVYAFADAFRAELCAREGGEVGVPSQWNDGGAFADICRPADALSLQRMQIQNLIKAKDDATTRFEEKLADMKRLDTIPTRVSHCCTCWTSPPCHRLERTDAADDRNATQQSCA